jgi:TRAP-type transport system periplasmic protein
MKKHLAVLAILLLLLFAITGCGGEDVASDVDTDGAQDQDTEVVEKPDPVQFTLHHQNSPTDALGRSMEAWAREVEEKTDGVVVITVYPSATLGPGPEGLELAQGGTADIAWGSLGLTGNRFPLNDIFLSPMIGIVNGYQGSRVAWEWYETSTHAQKEWEVDNIKLLTLFIGGDSPMGLNRQVETIDDMRGLNIRTIGGGPTELLKRAGAVPVIMGPGEVYQQMERGILDGWSIAWPTTRSFNYGEITPYIYEFSNYGHFGSMHFVVMNAQSYEKIPTQYREVFDSLCGEHFSQLVASTYEAGVAPSKEDAIAAGSTIEDLPKALEDSLKVFADEITIDYIENLNGRGLPGTEAYEEIKALFEKYPN